MDLFTYFRASKASLAVVNAMWTIDLTISLSFVTFASEIPFTSNNFLAVAWAIYIVENEIFVSTRKMMEESSSNRLTDSTVWYPALLSFSTSLAAIPCSCNISMDRNWAICGVRVKDVGKDLLVRCVDDLLVGSQRPSDLHPPFPLHLHPEVVVAHQGLLSLLLASLLRVFQSNSIWL